MDMNNNPQTEEMSTVDEWLPRYYKGYDMDILITKMRNMEELTDEEDDVICEAQNIYHEKHFEKVRENTRKSIEEANANGDYVMCHINPNFKR